jgi:hypothetical protein
MCRWQRKRKFQPERPLHRNARPFCFAKRLSIEAGTGNVSLIGIFGGFVVRQVPGNTRPFTAYLQLTDGISNHEYEITVEIHDLSNGTVICLEPLGIGILRWPGLA